MKPLLSEEYLPSDQGKERQRKKMATYYRFQSKIYDMTRWSFLFGREKVIEKIPSLKFGDKLLEIGCGTGHNLGNLSERFPENEVIGLDISPSMLKKAKKKYQDNKKIKVLGENFLTPKPSSTFGKVDLVLFSYSLSMINPQWPEFIAKANQMLNKEGYIAIVDFENTKSSWFKKHMLNNHVRMDTHLKENLQQTFETVSYESYSAYNGLWNYYIFIGKKE